MNSHGLFPGLIVLLVISSFNGFGLQPAGPKSERIKFDVVLVEARLNSANETGVEWLDRALREHGSVADPVSQFAAYQSNERSLASGILTSDVDIVSAVARGVEHGNLRVLAEPSILSALNQKATVDVSSEVPYVSPDVPGGTALVDVGLKVSLVPRRLDHGRLKIDIDATNSKLLDPNFTGVPDVERHSMKSALEVDSGRTIFISGLHRHVGGQNEAPTELIVFVTCRAL